MPIAVNVQTSIWMELLTAVNGKKYYIIGRVADRYDTMAVTEKGGNGGTKFFCQNHKVAYSIHGHCEECQKQVVNVEPDAAVTACNTP